MEPALRMAAEVAEGLSALHAHDWVHRDLKPANILFDEHGQAHVADLGLAQVPGGPSQRSQFSEPQPHPGTPEYMSPEQESSGKVLKPPSDVYALGLVLFEMLTGRSHIYVKPGTRARELRADLPAALDDLLARMLSENPKERPWDGQEAAGELGKLQAGALAEQARKQAAQQAQARQKVVEEEAQKQAALLEEQRRKVEIARQEALAREKALALELREQELARQSEIQPAAKARRMQAMRPPQKSFLERFWPALLVVGLLMLWGIGNLMKPAAVPTAAPAATMAPVSTAAPAAPVVVSTLTPIPPATALPVSPTSIQSATAQGGMTTQVRQKDGMTMVYVPGGTFTMGSADITDAAQHQVTLSAYWIDRTDVTNALFTKFVTAQNYKTDAEKAGLSYGYIPAHGGWEQVSGADWQHPQGPTTSLSGLDQHPVVHVSWNDATAYCAWAGARLPTEAQWELAARGTDGRTYPWGEQKPDGSLANFADKNLAGASWADQTVDDHYEFTSPVGNYPAGVSPYGALDMAGNVWQWTADWYDKSYYGTSPVSNPSGPTNGTYQVLRGGSWGYGTDVLRSANRHYGDLLPSDSANNAGFRCARSN